MRSATILMAASFPDFLTNLIEVFSQTWTEACLDLKQWLKNVDELSVLASWQNFPQKVIRFLHVAFWLSYKDPIPVNCLSSCFQVVRDLIYRVLGDFPHETCKKVMPVYMSQHNVLWTGHVFRGCYIDPKPAIPSNDQKCESRDGVRTCLCQVEMCNASSRTNLTTTTLSLSACLIFLTARFFW